MDTDDLLMSAAPAENFSVYRAVQMYDFDDSHAFSFGPKFPMPLKGLKEAPQLGKPLLKTAVPSSSSSSSSTSSFRCRERPTFLTYNHFFAEQQDFELLRAAVDRATVNLDEHIDSTYIEKDHMVSMNSVVCPSVCVFFLTRDISGNSNILTDSTCENWSYGAIGTPKLKTTFWNSNESVAMDFRLPTTSFSND
jgi:hypothetical protein